MIMHDRRVPGTYSSADDRTFLGSRQIPSQTAVPGPAVQITHRGEAGSRPLDLDSKPHQTSFMPVAGVEGEACMSRKTNLDQEPLRHMDKIRVTHPDRKDVSGDLP